MLEKVTLPQDKRGHWRIERFEVDRPDIHSMLRGRGVTPGKYTRLMRGNTLVMSDTPAEMRDHFYAVRAAHGSCLINGLGIGMVLKACLKKPEVTDITVVEISQELIDMVSPHYQDKRVTIVCASAFDYKPPNGKRYGMVWHDIWDFICSDNLPEMHKLHRKYGRRADWQGSWCREQCEYAR
jgi:spermidine synthase